VFQAAGTEETTRSPSFVGGYESKQVITALRQRKTKLLIGLADASSSESARYDRQLPA
jgi:hypothetical protein